VDDDNFNTQIISDYLRKLDIESIICNNGKEAVDTCLLCHKEIGMIITDCEMPIMDGYSMASNVKKLCTANKLNAITVVGLTGHANEAARRKCLDSGMNSVIFKPCSFSMIKQIVNLYMK